VTRRLRLLAVVPALLAGLSACGTATLSADEVATKAEDALEHQIGVRPTISCPDDVKAEVGATTRCTLTGGEDPTKYGVSIKVTEVDGDNAKFDITVDDQPQG
jgi:Domain of unknown function (DUF4333)